MKTKTALVVVFLIPAVLRVQQDARDTSQRRLR